MLPTEYWQIFVFLVIIFAPFVASVILLLFGRFVSRSIGLSFNLFHMLVSLFFISYLFYHQTFCPVMRTFYLYRWACLDTFCVDIRLNFDHLNITMLFFEK